MRGQEARPTPSLPLGSIPVYCKWLVYIGCTVEPAASVNHLWMPEVLQENVETHYHMTEFC